MTRWQAKHCKTLQGAWDYGVGGFAFRVEDGVVAWMYLILPWADRPGDAPKQQICRLNLISIHTWDGNRENPTISPSIGYSEDMAPFHGWLEGGILRDDEG